MIVVDASVAVKWLIPEAGEKAAKALLVDARQLVAPALIRIEVAAAILRLFRENRISEEIARSVCAAWDSMLDSGVVQLIDDEELYPAAVDVGFKSRHALQDCLYLAAGKMMKAELVTADRTLHERGSKITGRIRLLDMNDAN